MKKIYSKPIVDITVISEDVMTLLSGPSPQTEFKEIEKANVNFF